MQEQLSTYAKKPRGPCPVCNQGFSPATDRQWAQRWNYHLLMSERHKKYVALASKPPARIFLRPWPPDKTLSTLGTHHPLWNSESKP